MRIEMNTSYVVGGSGIVGRTVQIHRERKLEMVIVFSLWIEEETMEKRYIILKIEEKEKCFTCNASQIGNTFLST